MVIFTGSYSNCKTGNLVSISGDKGKDANFFGNAYTLLAPKKDFFRTWKDNKRNQVDEDENNIYYMTEFYNKVLKPLDPQKVLDDLSTFGNNIIILCYEESFEFCHRHLVATWLERKLNIRVHEVATDEDGCMYHMARNTKYIRQFNDIIDKYDKA